MHYSLSLGGVRTFFVDREGYLFHIFIQIALTLVGFAVLLGIAAGGPGAGPDHLPIVYILLFLVGRLRISHSRSGADRSEPVFSLPMSAHFTLNFVLFSSCFALVVINSIR
jgi:hypothetical protein